MTCPRPPNTVEFDSLQFIRYREDLQKHSAFYLTGASSSPSVPQNPSQLEGIDTIQSLRSRSMRWSSLSTGHKGRIRVRRLNICQREILMNGQIRRVLVQSYETLAHNIIGAQVN